MNIIFLSLPGAGKGTQSDLLKKDYNLGHISAGELLREESSSGSELGNQIASIINEGKLVDDDLILRLVDNKINTLSDKEGIIFDGFPRTIYQAEKLEQILNEKYNDKVDIVLNLVVTKDTAMKRILGRTMCPKCNYIYNIYLDKFNKEGYCNDCDVELEKRLDDSEEKFNIRFKTYLNNTKPLIDYYKNKNILYEIDGSNDRETVYEDIRKVLKGIND